MHQSGLDEAFRRLDRFVERSLAHHSTPGLSLALTDATRTLRVATYGLADVAARTPVTPDTVFEVGSIGKSFTALTLLRMRERGLIDFHVPVNTYLPWFEVRSTYEPITIHHLLSHTAGIIGGSDVAYDGRFEAWALRDTEVSGPPGEYFHYSNVGYKTLGYLIEDVTGRGYGEVVREEILSQIGMHASVTPITDGDRARVAVPHRRLRDDRPWNRRDPVVPAMWIECATADGSIASTPEDMAMYVRLLLNRGRFEDSIVVVDDSYWELTSHVATRAFGDQAMSYGYGIASWEVNGHLLYGHGGGMVGHYSSLVYEPAVGLGVVAMVNGPGDPYAVALFALETARAALSGNQLPEPPDLTDPSSILDATARSGTYRSEARVLTLERADLGANMTVDGRSIPVQSRGEDRLYVDDPGFDRFLVGVVRDGDDVVALHHGGEWYAREGVAQPSAPVAPAAWAAFLGHYRCHNPWQSNFYVVLRRGKLVLIHPSGGEESLEELASGEFRVGETPSPERVRFDAIADGKALRANLGGQDFYRSPDS